MRPKAFFNIIVLFCACVSASAQYDTLQVDWIIQRLQALQVAEDTFYNPGLFRNQREWEGRSVEDNTFSYSATISHVLQKFSKRFSPTSKIIARDIVRNVNKNAFRYANRKGEASFNFWQTVYPDLPFPNGTKYRKHEHRLPDDLDDSSVIALALANDSLSNLIRQKINIYALNNNHKEVPSAPESYRHTQAYRTWFADKWIQDIDVSVNANILMFVLANGFPLTKFDSASIDHIKRILESQEHFTIPEEVSPYYTSPAKILYHITRMMDYDQSHHFTDIRHRLIMDLRKVLMEEDSEMEKLLALSSLYRLGESSDVLLDVVKLGEEVGSFHFFSGFGYLPFPPFKSWLVKRFSLVPNMYWKSEAFNLMLVLDYLMVSGRSLESDFFDRFSSSRL